MNFAGLPTPKGFSENVTIDDGVNEQGVHLKLHCEGDSLIVQKTWDAAPHLEYAKRAREATEGQNWGNGRLIGHIPPVEYAKICALKDPKERRAAAMRFLRENQAFVMFDKALK